MVLLVAVLLFVFIGSAVIDQSQVMHVSILDKYAAPGAVSPNGGTYLLGADEGGRDVWGQLIIGARNSILIVFPSRSLHRSSELAWGSFQVTMAG